MRRQVLLRTVSLVLVFLLVAVPVFRQTAAALEVNTGPTANISQSGLQNASINMDKLSEGQLEITLPDGQTIKPNIPGFDPSSDAEFNQKATELNMIYMTALDAWAACNYDAFYNALDRLETHAAAIRRVVEENRKREQEMWENVRKLEDTIRQVQAEFAEKYGGSIAQTVVGNLAYLAIGTALGGPAGLVIGIGAVLHTALDQAVTAETDKQLREEEKNRLDELNNMISQQAQEILKQALISLLWQQLDADAQAKLRDLRGRNWDHCGKTSEPRPVTGIGSAGLCGTAQVAGYGQPQGGLCGTAQVMRQWEEVCKSQPKDSSTGQPLDGSVIVIPEDGPPQVNPEDPKLQPGDTIVVTAPCHEKKEYVVGKDPIPEELNLEAKDLRYIIDHGNAAAIDQIISDLAEQGIEVDRNDIKIKENVVPGYDEVKIKKFTKKESECPRTQPPGDTGIPCCPNDGSQPPPPGGEGGDPGLIIRDGQWYEENKERHGQQASAYPNDPYFRSKGSWGQSYDDQWALKRIGFSDPSIWPKTGEKIIVAVIDTGVDFHHPELYGALWRNEGEIPGNGIDDDNNGYVDDVYGWNFVDNNNDVSDNNGHGTLVSGIIAAWTDNFQGMAGVNPYARIMTVKVTDIDNSGGSINLAKGIRYAVDNGARVINISVGGKGLSRIENAAVEYARRNNVLVVVASGNEGIQTLDYSPAGLPGALTVASTDLDDRRVSFSNWGPAIDLAAPGVDILSLRAGNTDMLLFEKDDYEPGKAFVGENSRYYRTAGSSFSAPFVSGAASLILSIDPSLTAEEVRRKLIYSARDIEAPGVDQYTGFGLLDVPAALKQDPTFSLDPRIKNVQIARSANGGLVLNVIGTVHSDRLKSYRVEAGQGENPSVWKMVGQKGKTQVTDDILVTFPIEAVKGAPLWILRLVAEHENGREIENRYTLRLQ